MKKMISLLAGAMLMMGMATAANALTLTLDQGTNHVSVTDEGLGDTKPGAGIIGWSGTLGIFNVDITSRGITSNSSALAYLDLLQGAVTNGTGGTGTLKVTLTDTFTNLALLGISPNAQASSHIGGTVAGLPDNNGVFGSGNVTFNTYYNTSTPLTSVTGLTGSSFSSDKYTLFDAATPFDVTLELLITHNGAADTTFDSNIKIVPTPEPGTIVLLGAGLLGLGFYGRRRMQK